MVVSPPISREVSPAALAFGLLGGAFAWIVHLMGMYALHPLECARGSVSLMLALTVVTALVTVAAGLVAFKHRNAASTSGVVRGRARFMARTGLLLDILFLYIIAAESLPLLYDDPCRGFEVQALLFRAVGAVLLLVGAVPSVAFAHTGPVPAPAEVWSAWSWDPWTVAPLAFLVVVYARGQRRMRAPKRRWARQGEAVLFALAMFALGVALVSPLDSVSDALFSMHMVQHLLLTAVAAPLLAFAGTGRRVLAALPAAARPLVGRAFGRRAPMGRAFRGATRPLVAAGLHLVALWAWHVPALYEAALENQALHLVEHASFVLTAVLLWSAVGRVVRAGGGEAGVLLLAIFLTALHSALLGGLITLAPMPWYPSHAGGVEGWGRTPLEDQQLAGLLMWIPSGVAYLAATLAVASAWMGASERRVRMREAAATARPSKLAGEGA
jgi:putative membrane protein